MNEIGPEAMPLVVMTTSPSGRRCEKEKPVPPPLCWIMAASRRAPKMLSKLGPDSNGGVVRPKAARLAHDAIVDLQVVDGHVPNEIAHFPLGDQLKGQSDDAP